MTTYEEWKRKHETPEDQKLSEALPTDKDKLKTFLERGKASIAINEHGHAKSCRCDECVKYWQRHSVEPDREAELENEDCPCKDCKHDELQGTDYPCAVCGSGNPKFEPKWEQVEPDRDTYDPKSKYYDAGNIEVLDIIKAKLTEEQYQGFCLGNAIKYTCRANHKGDFQRDLEKARFYLGESE